MKWIQVILWFQWVDLLLWHSRWQVQLCVHKRTLAFTLTQVNIKHLHTYTHRYVRMWNTNLALNSLHMLFSLWLWCAHKHCTRLPTADDSMVSKNKVKFTFSPIFCFFIIFSFFFFLSFQSMHNMQAYANAVHECIRMAFLFFFSLLFLIHVNVNDIVCRQWLDMVYVLWKYSQTKWHKCVFVCGTVCEWCANTLGTKFAYIVQHRKYI